MKKLSTFIPTYFYALFFFVPIILFPRTSELFEFNKIVCVYVITALIVASWALKMIFEKKFIFRRTALDFPILLLLAALFLSTVTSVDTRSSIFGYYSRFNGGLISAISYSILYWAYVTHMDSIKTLKSIYFITASVLLVSIYGILQHFGVDKDVWVQDVQSRVFSTLGQPNWLAAFLTGVIPITWAFAINNFKYKLLNFKKDLLFLWLALSSIFFLVLLYSGSRSGLLGFAVADIIFWGVAFYSYIHTPSVKKRVLKTLVATHIIFVIIALLNGTQFTPGISNLLKRDSNGIATEPDIITGTSLETGGTESGYIRQIVWKGAVNLWKQYPILGTGVETFAYSYYKVRPVEHNLVSEWQYLYNKAHNEYLNYAATTGTVGLTAYFTLVITMVFVLLKKGGIITKFTNKSPSSSKTLNIAILSGFASILVTNFFGFSVVIISLLFYLFPAMTITINESGITNYELKVKSFSISQKIGALLTVILTSYFLILISKYWYADVLYARGKLEQDAGNYAVAQQLLEKAVDLSSKEAFYWEELSQSTTQIALALFEEEKTDLANSYARQAVSQSERSVELSPANVNLKRTMASMYIRLSSIDLNYLIYARNTLIAASIQAPTDAQLLYNLGLAYIRTGEADKALNTFYKTIEMKPDYRNARIAAAIVLADLGDIESARAQLEYILTNINPDDSLAKQQLEELGN